MVSDKYNIQATNLYACTLAISDTCINDVGIIPLTYLSPIANLTFTYDTDHGDPDIRSRGYKLFVCKYLVPPDTTAHFGKKV